MNLAILQAHNSHIQVLIEKLRRGKIVILELFFKNDLFNLKII